MQYIVYLLKADNPPKCYIFPSPWKAELTVNAYLHCIQIFTSTCEVTMDKAIDWLFLGFTPYRLYSSHVIAGGKATKQ